MMIEQLWVVSWIAVKALALVLVLLLSVAYLTYFERKVIGYIQGRIGPNRVGPAGLFQPFADVIKLLNKELIFPTDSNRFLFLIAPVLSIGTAIAAWAAIPLDQYVVLANMNAGLLYVFAVS